MALGQTVELSSHSILDEIPGIVWTTDCELRFTSLRGGDLWKLGLEQNQVVGMTLFTFFQTSQDGAPSIAAHRSALAGRDSEYQQDWCGSLFQVVIKPRRNEDGEIIGCIGIARDITSRRHAEQERQQVEQLQKAINNILGVFSKPNPLEQQLHRCLDTLFGLPWLSVESCGAIFLTDAAKGTLTLRAQRGLPTSLQTMCRHVAYGHCLCGRVASTGEIVFADHVDHRHDTCYEGIVDHGHYCIPLAADDELLGVLNLYVKAGHCRQVREEQFLSSVGAVIGGAIKYRQVAEELREQNAQFIAAEEIQSALLRDTTPQVPGFDIAAACYPAAFAAGDHFDFLRPEDNRLLLVIGDVSGHGVGPAILMATFCAHLRSLVRVEPDLEALIRQLNAIITQECSEQHFITMLVGELDIETRSLSYIRCGHPPAIILDGDGQLTASLDSGQLPLGVVSDAAYQREGPIRLRSGDILVLFTDGLLEVSSPKGTYFGVNSVVDTVRENRHKSASEIIHALRSAAQAFQGFGKFKDDITVVIGKVQ